MKLRAMPMPGLHREAGTAEVAGVDIAHRRELAILWPLLGQPIAFHRRLVGLTRNVKPAVMLSQMIYWTLHGRDVASRDGWFYKTRVQWQWETGLSVKEQNTARRQLRTLGLVEERRHGVPATLHFRVVLPRLAALLGEHIAGNAAHLYWEDGAALTELLGPALAYHPRLVSIAGGVNAGLLLSRALQLTRAHSKDASGGWFCRSGAQWTLDLGLTRRELETARRGLVAAGIWHERLLGIPSRLLTRIPLDCLLSRLLEPAAPRRVGVPGTVVGTFCAEPGPSHRDTQECHSGLRKTSNPDVPKAPTQMSQKRHHCTADSANVHIQGITECLLQPPQRAAQAGRMDHPPRGGGEWVFPDKLLPEERVAAAALLQQCAPHAQALLDELAGRLQQNTVHTSALAYLRGMVRRAQAGEFMPELGLRIAAARRVRDEQEVQRLQREADARHLALEQTTPGYRERVAARQTEVRKFLDELKSARRAGGAA